VLRPWSWRSISSQVVKGTRLGRPFANGPGVIKLGDRYLIDFLLPPFAKGPVPTNAPRGWCGRGAVEFTSRCRQDRRL
jgi:hypothetical protein